MSGVVIRHGRLDVVLDPGDPVRVTRNGWSCVGRVVESAPGHTMIAFAVPPPAGAAPGLRHRRRVDDLEHQTIAAVWTICIAFPDTIPRYASKKYCASTVPVAGVAAAVMNDESSVIVYEDVPLVSTTMESGRPGRTLTTVAVELPAGVRVKTSPSEWSSVQGPVPESAVSRPQTASFG